MKAVRWLILTSLVFIGCAAPIKNLTRTQYVSPSLNARAISEGGLALFPVTAGQSQEGFRRPLGDHMNLNLPLTVPNGRTLTWQVVMKSLNDNGLVEEYQQLILTYQQTAILDKVRAKKLADALGVRYALFCSLRDFSKASQFDNNPLSGSTVHARVYAQCLILDLENGDIVQEIIGEASTATSSETLAPIPSYDKFAQKIAHSVMSQIPGSKVIE